MNDDAIRPGARKNGTVETLLVEGGSPAGGARVDARAHAGRPTPRAASGSHAVLEGRSISTDRTAPGGERARHRALYREIPSMRCEDGCAACCGPAPVSPWEAERLGIPGAVVTPTHPGTRRCAFHVDGACSVYDRRPFACRLYGTSDVAPCERGRAHGRPIPTGKAIARVHRFEETCPSDRQDRRRTAVRGALVAAGDTEALDALDGHAAHLEGLRDRIGLIDTDRTGTTRATSPTGDDA